MWDFKANRYATARIERMETALADFKAGRVSRQKFYGVLRRETNFRSSFWENDEDYSEQNMVFAAEHRLACEAKGIKPQPTEREKLAKELGMPADSIIVGKVLSGEMTREEAEPICENIRYRHRGTNYDSLLDAGLSKEQARDEMRPMNRPQPRMGLTTPKGARTMKTIADYQLVDHGIQHEQYFQGCGIALTDYEDVATGIGDNPAEAIDDALEQLAMNDWETDGMEERIIESDFQFDRSRRTRKLPTSPRVTSKHGDDAHYYVSIRVKS